MNKTFADKALIKYNSRRLKECKLNSESTDFKFAVKDDNWYFQFTVQEGLYKGQTHIIETKLTYGQDPDIYVYPMHAPLCSFITTIWHPNISEKGTICLDVLKENWTPSMFTSTIIQSIITLLLNPEASSPQNGAAAKMILDKETYAKKINSFYTYSDVHNLFK